MEHYKRTVNWNSVVNCSLEIQIFVALHFIVFSLLSSIELRFLVKELDKV
jgi:hypothetical protein